MNDYDTGDPAMLMRYTLQVGVTMGSALFTFDGFFFTPFIAPDAGMIGCIRMFNHWA